MIANIIHDKHGRRHRQLMKEINDQNIDYVFWNPIFESAFTNQNISRAHKQIVQYASDKNMDMVLIMEDDVAFTCPGAFKYFINNIPKVFDLYLAGIYSGRLRFDDTVCPFSATHCYIVNRDFYDTFLSVNEALPIDAGLSELSGTYKVCNPMTAFQHTGLSYNTGRLQDYSPRIKGYKKYGI